MDLRECGENCQKYHKRGWNRTEGRMGQRVGALNGEGARTPLRTMYYHILILPHISHSAVYFLIPCAQKKIMSFIF